MQISSAFQSGRLAIGTLLAFGLFAQAQPPTEGQGIPPRTAPADYQAKAEAGTVTIAADFVGHAVPTPQGALTSEDFVAFEVAVYGPAGARLKLSFEDFSIRINGKKMPALAQQFGLVMRSLKDPEWQPETPPDSPKSKGGMSTGGGGAQGDPKPEPPKMPFPLRRAMEQRVQKVVLPEGDRALPLSGLIFFSYRGKDQSIHNVELIYSGPAGKATLTIEQ